MLRETYSEAVSTVERAVNRRIETYALSKETRKVSKKESLPRPLCCCMLSSPPPPPPLTLLLVFVKLGERFLFSLRAGDRQRLMLMRKG